MSDTIPYIQTDEHGALRVGATRVMIDSIVAGFRQGLSAESIHEQYPALSLEEVYGAIAYYLRNRAAVDRYLEGQQNTWNRLRDESRAVGGTVMQRLSCQPRCHGRVDCGRRSGRTAPGRSREQGARSGEQKNSSAVERRSSPPHE